MRLLLKWEDVTPDKQSKCGRNTFSWAAQNGDEGIVRLLLKRGDVSPDRLDNRRKTPLSLAARYGNTGVVKLLIAQKATFRVAQGPGGTASSGTSEPSYLLRLQP